MRLNPFAITLAALCLSMGTGCGLFRGERDDRDRGRAVNPAPRTPNPLAEALTEGFSKLVTANDEIVKAELQERGYSGKYGGTSFQSLGGFALNGTGRPTEDEIAQLRRNTKLTGVELTRGFLGFSGARVWEVSSLPASKADLDRAPRHQNGKIKLPFVDSQGFTVFAVSGMTGTEALNRLDVWSHWCADATADMKAEKPTRPNLPKMAWWGKAITKTPPDLAWMKPGPGFCRIKEGPDYLRFTEWLKTLPGPAESGERQPNPALTTGRGNAGVLMAPVKSSR